MDAPHPARRPRRCDAGAHSARAAPVDEPQLLSSVADLLDQSFAHGDWGTAPTLVRVVGEVDGRPIDEVELGLRAVDEGESPVEALLGFTAPPAWCVLGVVTEGRAHHLAEGGAAGDGLRPDGRPPTRARVVHLVGRGGASASVLRLQGREPQHLAGRAALPDGRLDEVCRRALGLPTAPPAVSPQQLWATVWLDRAVTLAAPRPRPTVPTWADLARLHPAAAVIAADDPFLAAQAPDHLVEMGNAMVLAWSWTDLRHGCGTGRWPVEDIEPWLADWMDDGMFARWALAPFPPLGDLLALLHELVPASTHRRVVDALREWRLVPATSPEAA